MAVCEIKPGIFVETELVGCNPGVVFTSRGAVLIDSPLPYEKAIKWRKEIEERAELLFLINTEHHLDHTVGNFIFRDISIIAHSLTRKALEEERVERIREALREIYTEPVTLPEDFSIILPSITFEGRITLHFEGLTFEILHFPGHTPGQTCVYIPEEKIIFTGDNIFSGVQTFLHQSLPFDWLRSLEKMKEMDIELIVPGHGDICTKSYIDEQASFIREWIEAVEEAIRKGWSLEEAQERISFLDRYPMDRGLEKAGERLKRMNVERLYKVLKGEV